MLGLQVHAVISFCVRKLETQSQVLVLAEQMLLPISEATWKRKGFFPILITVHHWWSEIGSSRQDLGVRTTAEAIEEGF